MHQQIWVGRWTPRELACGHWKKEKETKEEGELKEKAETEERN